VFVAARRRVDKSRRLLLGGMFARFAQQVARAASHYVNAVIDEALDRRVSSQSILPRMD